MSAFFGIISICKSDANSRDKFINAVQDRLFDFSSFHYSAIRTYDNVTYLYFKSDKVPDLQDMLFYPSIREQSNDINTNDLHMVVYNRIYKKFIWFFGYEVQQGSVGKRWLSTVHEHEFTLRDLHCLGLAVSKDIKWDMLTAELDVLSGSPIFRTRISNSVRNRINAYASVANCLSLGVLSRDNCREVLKKSYRFFHK